jgi:hypothetical protein
MKPGTRYITVNDVKETDADCRRDGAAFPLVAQRQMERDAAPREGSIRKILTEPDGGATNTARPALRSRTTTVSACNPQFQPHWGTIASPEQPDYPDELSEVVNKNGAPG